jgi:hypothetical protein
MLGPHGLELEFHRENASFEHSSVDGFVTFYEVKFGPILMAKAALGEKWPALRSDLVELYSKWNKADDGTARLEPEYLLTIGRKRG